MRFITSCIKWLVLCFWLCAGTISFLAAQNMNRQLDSAKSELATYKSQLDAAQSEVTTFRDQLALSVVSEESMRTEAAKWRSKFETICRQVESLAGTAVSVVAE